MALIVAASLVRSELTSLAWAHAKTSTDGLATAVSQAANNRARAEILECALADGVVLHVSRDTDRWAVERLDSLRRDLASGIGSTQRVIQRAFVRLYRHRNLMVHAGRIDAVGSDSALRLAAPLGGAGLDRIADAMLERGTPPLELAAAARVRLAALNPATTTGGSGVVDLLE